MIKPKRMIMLMIILYNAGLAIQSWRSEEILGLRQGRAGATAILTDQVQMLSIFQLFTRHIITLQQDQIDLLSSGLVGDRGTCPEPFAPWPLLFLAPWPLLSWSNSKLFFCYSDHHRCNGTAGIAIESQSKFCRRTWFAFSPPQALRPANCFRVSGNNNI